MYLHPDDKFRSATAELFGDTKAPLGAGGEDSGSLVVTAAASTNETGGVVGSPPVSPFPTAPPFLTELQRRNQQVEQQDYP
jgi:hypothetical protein